MMPSQSAQSAFEKNTATYSTAVCEFSAAAPSIFR